MNEYLKEEIAYLRDSKTHLWAATLATFGGSFGLTFTPIPFIVKLILMIGGFILSILFLDNYFKKGDKIERMINILKKRGK